MKAAIPQPEESPAGGRDPADHDRAIIRRAGLTPEPAPRSEPEPQRSRSGPWIRWAAILLSVFLAYQLAAIVAGWIRVLLPVLLLVIFAGVLAFLLSPLVKRLELLGLGRSLPILVLYIGVVVVIGGLAVLIAQPIGSELHSLITSYPRYLTQLEGQINQVSQLARRLGIPAGNVNLGSLGPSLSALTGAKLLGQVVQLFAGVVDVVIGVLLVFVIGFYLLRDGDRLRQGARQLLPTSARPKYDFACEALSTVVGGYIRAQLLMAAIIGLLAGAGCLVLGVHFAIVIGVMAFALELVPFVGALTAAVVAVVLALLQSFHLAVEVVILFIVIHIVEGYLLGPRITGKRVHLHPLAALLAMVLGIKIAGILGALFAVPLAGLVNVLVRALYYDLRAQRPEQFGSRPADRWGGWKKAWAQLRARRQESTFPRIFGPKDSSLTSD